MNRLALKEEAFRLYMEGKTQVEIARTLRVTEKTVGQWKKKYGWDEKFQLRKIGTAADLYRIIYNDLRISIADKMEKAKRLNASNKPKEGKRLLEDAVEVNQALEGLHKIFSDYKLLGPEHNE